MKIKQKSCLRQACQGAPHLEYREKNAYCFINIQNIRTSRKPLPYTSFSFYYVFSLQLVYLLLHFVFTLRTSFWTVFDQFCLYCLLWEDAIQLLQSVSECFHQVKMHYNLITLFHFFRKIYLINANLRNCMNVTN